MRSRRATKCGPGSPANSACRRLLATPRARDRRHHAASAPSCPPRRAPSSSRCWAQDRVRDDNYERAFHARGRSYHDLLRLRAGDLASAPDAVLYPRGTDEVLALLTFAARERHRGRALWRRHERRRRRQRRRAANSEPSSRSICPAWTALIDVDPASRHRDGGSGHLWPRARESACARKGPDARPLSAIVRVLDARRLDRASRRGPGIAPLWPRGGLAASA